MPLTQDEIKSIGKKSGQVVAHCRKRSLVVYHQIHEAHNLTNNIIMSAAPQGREHSREDIKDQISLLVNEVKETLPSPGTSPLSNLVLSELEKARDIADKVDGSAESIAQVAVVTSGLEVKLTDLMLTDYAECACDSGSVKEQIKGMVTKLGEWYDNTNNSNEVRTELANTKGRLEFLSLRIKEPTASKKPSRSEVKVTVWEERDRLHIGIVDKATEQISYADWWDDGAREMFEDGFFKSGRQLENSVLEYAEDMGILAK